MYTVSYTDQTFDTGIFSEATFKICMRVAFISGVLPCQFNFYDYYYFGKWGWGVGGGWVFVNMVCFQTHRGTRKLKLPDKQKRPFVTLTGI